MRPYQARFGFQTLGPVSAPDSPTRESISPPPATVTELGYRYRLDLACGQFAQRDDLVPSGADCVNQLWQAVDRLIDPIVQENDAAIAQVAQRVAEDRVLAWHRVVNRIVRPKDRLEAH